MNQRVSKVVDGVTVYDYTDLPAFFGPSGETPLTPKYPINVTITADAVLFRLHYSSYKYSSEDDNSDGTVYKLHLEDMLRTESGRESDLTLTTVHMEEMIMELPFVDTHRLAGCIREVYNTLFPMPVGKNQDKYGGRFFHELLKKRYRSSEEETVEGKMYKQLHEMASKNCSYSRLNQMGIADDIYEGEEVKKFLRKLLLDFMFDLRHSDIFQLNPRYRQMLSGLMSDYYFASLLHKCEYYYQLELVGEERKKLDDKALTGLYYKDLFRAEDEWVRDIMDSRAEDTFKPADEVPTWFEYPEDEMRSLCFENEKGNVDTWIMDSKHDLRNKRAEKPAQSFDELRSMVLTHDRNREAASRWFLRRYDFRDVFRLHFSDVGWFKISVWVLVMLVCVTFSITAIPVEVPIVLTLVSFVSLFFVAARNMCRRRERWGHVIASLHLVMPRLVAAIATAWFSLALCYELVIAVYKMPPSWVVVAIVLVALVIFSLYKINLFVPNASVKSKLGRMGLFLLLSYFISIVIGFVMVGCVGEPFLMEYLQGEGYCIGHAKQMIDNEGFRHGMVIVFRGLTITFSFVAMFIGVFIQMIVGEEKQMTEM